VPKILVSLQLVKGIFLQNKERKIKVIGGLFDIQLFHCGFVYYGQILLHFLYRIS